MRNDELIDSVKDELARDPNVDSDAIAVSADDGVVRLRGTAGSLCEKREAEKDAKRVSGVELVTDNKLQLRPLSNREDADLRGEVLQALASGRPRPCHRGCEGQRRGSHADRHR